MKQASYYQQYLDMVARNHKPKEVGKKKTATEVQKSKKPAPLVDEEEEIQHEPEPQGEGEDSDVDRAAHSLIDLSKKKSTTNQFILQRRVQTTHNATTGPSSQPQDDVSEKDVQETLSPTDSTSVAEKDNDSEQIQSDTGSKALIGDEEKDKSRSSPEHDKVGEDQAGSNPRKSHEAPAGSNPEPIHEDFYATVYLDVHGNIKLRTDEHVALEDPPSPTGTLSSMKNLDDADNFRDQFLNEK
ncbi:hypothetical protein Tco_1161434 [Tanacetum coccineum]